jgi:hypothetical protein
VTWLYSPGSSDLQRHKAFFDLDRRRVSEIIEFLNTELAEILERMVAKDKR